MAGIKLNGSAGPTGKLPSTFQSLEQVTKAMLAKARTSGLTPKDCEKLGFLSITAEGVALKMKLPAHKAGFKIPYFNMASKQTQFWRFRYLEETKTGWAAITDKKSLRYVQEPDTVNELYFPPFWDWASVAADEEHPVLITEGELKAACATKLGFPTIGLGGVWMFRNDMGILPQWEDFAWHGRAVYIVFDSDAAVNPKVKQAENALCRMLTNDLGAVPHVVRLPATADGGKQGLDDFLVAEGRDAFSPLMSTAEKQPWAQAQELHQLNEEVIYVRDPGMIVRMDTLQKMKCSDFVAHAYSNRIYFETQEVEFTPPGGKPQTKTKTVEKLAPKEWLKWAYRAEVPCITYEPGAGQITDEGALNEWPGWACVPEAGSIKPFQMLMDHLFADATEADVHWLLQWLAYPLQHPGTKLHSAVAVWGSVHGTGKSLIGYTMRRIYGENWYEINDKHLNKDFNTWQANRQFILGDDITGGDKRGIADILKKMISQETIEVNKKFIPDYVVPDVGNYYFTSNHPDAFYVEDTDRRFFIHEVTADEPLDGDFYTKYGEWMDGPGGPALFAWLLDYDLTGFNPNAAPPMTEAKAEMIDLGRSDIDLWVARLKAAPDYTLRFGDQVLNYTMWTTRQLLKLYDPDGKSRVTENGLGRALKRSGLRKVYGGMPLQTWEGPQRLWAIRDVEALMKLKGPELSIRYDKERGKDSAVKAQPKFAAKAKKQDDPKDMKRFRP